MATNLLIITNISQVQHLRKNCPEILHSHKIIAVSPLAALDLYTDGFDVVLASYFLDAGEILALEEQGDVLSRDWYLPFSDALSWEGINLGELIRLDNLMFFKQALGAQKICEKIIQQLNPEEIIFFGPPMRACADGNAFTDRHDVFEATLLWQAEKNNIAVQQMPIGVMPGAAPSSPSRPQGKSDRCILFRDFVRDKNKPLAVAFGNDWDLVFLHPILRTLQESGNCQTLLLNMAKEINISTMKSGVVDSIDSFMSIQDFYPAARSLSSEIINRLEQSRLTFESTAYVDDYEFLNNPHLRFQFDHVWDVYFKTAVNWIDIYQIMYDSLRPDIALTLDPNYYLTRLFTLTAKKNDIRSVCVPHGHMVTYPPYLYFDSDLYLCSGEVLKQVIVEKHHKNPEQIHVVGDVALADIKHNFRRHTKRERKVIFLPSQRYVNFTLCKMDLERYVQAWQLIGEFLRRHPAVDLLLKPHPTNDYTEWFQKFFTDQGLSNASIIHHERVEETLAYTDVVLMLGRVSNAGLLPPLLEVPMLFLNTTSRVGSYSDFLWTAENGILAVTQPEEFSERLEQLLTDDNYAGQVIHQQKRLLQKHYSKIGDKTEARVCQAIDTLLH